MTRLPGAYWRLWWAGAVDNVGDGVFATAVPLLAVTLTRDPRLIATIAAAANLPWLLLSLPVGAAVDRYDRIRLMWSSQAVQAAVIGAVAVLVAAGGMDIGVLAGTALVLGCCEVVFGNAAQAVLPDIVPESMLHRANGNQYTVTNVAANFVGPPVGGLLFAVAMALPFGLDAVSFAVSAVLVATLPRRPVAPRPRRGAVAQGLRWLAGHRLLRTLAMLLAVNTFCFQLGNVTLVLLATRTLRLSTREFGVLLAAGAVGGVVGGLVSARLAARIGALPALLAALVANVFLFEAIGVSPDAVTLGASLAANGLATTVWSVVTVSLRQQLVPADLLGRVNSAYRMLGWGLIPLGAIAGGFVAQAFGPRAGYLIAGVLRGVALLLGIASIWFPGRAVGTAEVNRTKEKS